MLVLTAKNDKTLQFLTNFFDFKSMFHVDDVVGSFFYFEVDGQQDANRTEEEIEKELIGENKDLSYYFEYED